MKLGHAKSDRKAEKLLKSLRRSGDKYSSEFNLTIITLGVKNSRAVKRMTKVSATEEYLTAIAPSIVCAQLAEGLITKKGAFLPPNIVNHQHFVEHLKEYAISFEDELIEI